MAISSGPVATVSVNGVDHNVDFGSPKLNHGTQSQSIAEWVRDNTPYTIEPPHDGYFQIASAGSADKLRSQKYEIMIKNENDDWPRKPALDCLFIS